MLKKNINFPIWSIKVFKTNHNLSKQQIDYEFNQPTITALDVSDVSADFIADPFIISHNSKFYMFFEVLNRLKARGEIGLATSSDGENWGYEKIILREDYHLSYPHVVTFNNEFYMIPESVESNGVYLYKAKNFPYEWEKVRTMVEGYYFDASVFEYDRKWWMLVASPGKLHLYYSDRLDGQWQEHPKSPVIENNHEISRPAGRVILSNDKLFRFTQDNSNYYGKSVKSFEINELSVTNYKEEEQKVILEGSNNENDWRKDGMHHIDQLKISNDEWLIAVDGHTFLQENYIKWKTKRFLRNPIAVSNRVIRRIINKISSKYCLTILLGVENASIMHLGV